MNVNLTAEQQALINRAISDGRIRGTDDALRQAMDIWAERERTRAELIASLDAAEASLARGEGRIITQESMQQLAEEVHLRGLARLAAENSTFR
jgi:Arc/MetJ-type ribon-helix-helix transcriptional regulator